MQPDEVQAMQHLLVVVPCVHDVLQLKACDAACFEGCSACCARCRVIAVMIQPNLRQKDPNSGVRWVIHRHSFQEFRGFGYLAFSEEVANFSVTVYGGPGGVGYGGFGNVFEGRFGQS